MKSNFVTLICSSIITLIALIGSLIIEFGFAPFAHSDYYTNILLGIFASGLLLVVASIIGYASCKNDYYIRISDELISTSDIIILFTDELQNKTCQSTQRYVSTILEKFNTAKLLYSSEVGFYKSKRDRLIEVLLVKLIDYLELQKILDDYNQKLRKKEICIEQYTESFDAIVEEMARFSHDDLEKAKIELLEISDESKKWGRIRSKIIK